MAEAQAPPSKLSLRRRLQRTTTKLFSRGQPDGEAAFASAPSGGGSGSSSASSRPAHVPAPVRSSSHREGSSKTLTLKSLRSQSEPREGEGEEEQQQHAVDLSATKRVAHRHHAAAAAATTRSAASDEDEAERTDAEELSHPRGERLRIGPHAAASNLVRLLDVGFASVVGSQDHENEDRLLLRSNAHFHLLCVMDGHGGELAARFVAARLFGRLEAVYERLGGFPGGREGDEALVRMMHVLDDEFCAFARRRGDLSGVCVLAVVLYFDALETRAARKLVLNLGDCRVILREAVEARQPRDALGARVLALSTDHCASNRAEEARICANGGSVRLGRVAGLLEPSRTIGDVDLKEPEMKNWVIATPEIRRRALAVGRSLLVLATDGVWGVLPNHKVMAVALEALAESRATRRKGAASAAENAVRAIVEAARRRGSVDDISVIVAVV